MKTKSNKEEVNNMEILLALMSAVPALAVAVIGLIYYKL